MIYHIIESLIYLIGFFLLLFLTIYFMLFLMKEKWQKIKNKRGVELINKVHSKMKGISIYMINLFGILIKIILSSMLAIGMKPIIFKLNYPLGEGYATFASYCIAICLYMILPDLKYRSKKK